MNKKYFIIKNKEKVGPFSKDQLVDMNLSRNTMVWVYGMSKWENLTKVTELIDVLAKIPPEIKNIENINDPKREHEPRPKTNEDVKIKQSKLTKGPIWLLLSALISILIIYLVSISGDDTALYNSIVASSFNGTENFDFYVEKFYRDLGYYGIFPKKPLNTMIKFSNLDNIDNATHFHGLSFGSDNDDVIEIYINENTWRKFNKPMKYFLIYHELAHDILNLDDLEPLPVNKGDLMYPNISSYENISMDDFIESFHRTFEKVALEKY
jgi:hypothetical protein